MLHPRIDRLRDGLATLDLSVTSLWDRLIASDPGLLRLLLAARGTAAVFLMGLVAVLLGLVFSGPPVEAAPGVVLSMIGTFVMREPTWRQRQRTLLALALPAAAAVVVTTVLHGQGPLGDCFFLVLVFLCVLLQARGPAAIGQGLVAVVISYVGLYLELPVSSLPIQLLSVALAIPVTAFCSRVLFPMRPAVTLRRMVQAVQARAARALRDARSLAADDPASVQRLRRSLARLNEAALAADDQLAVLDPAGSIPLRRYLMDLELATAQLAVMPLESLTGRHAMRLRVAERRLRHGRWSARDLRPVEESGAAASLGAITRAAAALESAAVLKPAPHVHKPPPPPGPLAWRIAIRVTLAASLAMGIGMALSHDRWFWAVVSVYVVFLNTRSRGDTTFKGVERVCGTLIGLVAGMVIGHALKGDPVAEIAILVSAVFGMYYMILTSYTLGIMCVTVLLGCLYSLLGAELVPILTLRLEETAIGVVSAILVATLVMPVRTRDQVGRSGTAVLQALAAAVGQASRMLAGDTAATPLLAMRAVDRQMADLRLAVLPLTVGRLRLRRAQAERPVQALFDCVYWARMLAVGAATPDAAAGCRAEDIARRLATMADGDRSAPPPAASLPNGPAATTRMALDQLDRATTLLAESLAIRALLGARER